MLFEWIDKRLELGKFKKKYLVKTFPTHPSFLLGEMALFCFFTLVGTGMFLGYLYEPSAKPVTLFGASVPSAYASVIKLDLLPMGLIIRRVHHWSAMLMIAAVITHLGRVYFTSSYRNPREINWLVGLTLWAITMAEAFTGYLLPYSQFSVTATSIAYYTVKSTPWVGDWISRFLFAGAFPSEGTVPRFFFMHVMLIPAVLVSLIAVHMVILVKQKHVEPPSNRRRPEAEGGRRLIGTPIWPEQAVISLSFFLVLLCVISAIATAIPVNPIEKYGPPGPGTPVMRPDWYFLVVYGMLKLVPSDITFHVLGAKITPETIGGVFLPLLSFVVFALIPFVDRWREPQHYMISPLRRPGMTAFGIGGAVILCMLVVAGYIDELGISPAAMTAYIGIAAAVTWAGSWALLRLYNRKKGEE